MSADAIDLTDLHVLVVDDDPDSRQAVKRLLEQSHATVEMGDSVVQALFALRHDHFDLVVSDIGMPDQDGYELLRQLRALAGAAASTPAIALTAYATGEDRRRALSAGFQQHLVKPVEPRELLDAVAHFAHRQPGGPGGSVSGRVGGS